MKCLAYGEVLEGGGWILRDDLESVKKEWYFNVRVFEVPDNFDLDAHCTMADLFKFAKTNFKQIHSEGNLFHKKE